MQFHENNGVIEPRYIPQNTRKSTSRKECLFALMYMAFAIADIIPLRFAPEGVKAVFSVLLIGCAAMAVHHIQRARNGI